MFGITNPIKIAPSEPTMSMEQIIQSYIDEFDSSAERRSMIEGDKYYDSENNITKRVLYKYVDGAKVVDNDKPNNKLPHGFMKLLVDEKVAYLLGSAPIIAADDRKFEEKLIEILDDEFDDTIQEIGIEAANKGISWLQPYIDEDGELQFKKHDSEQIIAIYRDKARKKLETIIRYYFIEEYEGTNKKSVKKVEYWTAESVMYYTEYQGKLIPDIEANETGEPVGHFLVNDQHQSWGKVPFIAFKNNTREKNDLNYVKQLIDDYDKNTSDTSNTLEDIANFIYVLKNYGGTNLSEFMNDLKLYKAVKVEDDGGVDKLSADLNIDATEKHLDRLKKDIYIFGQGVDMDAERFGNSPSGIALKFLYASLDLKCDHMERKFKRAFKELFWFITEYLKLTGQGTYDPAAAKVTFIRNMLTNTSDTINDCKNSMGMVSKKTILEHHPFVGDLDEELLRMKEEEQSIDLDIIPDDGDNGGKASKGDDIDE